MSDESKPAGRPRRRPKLPEKLDDSILRCLVFQTFGHDRKTQDSPIVPDVWLRYILVTEATAHAHIAMEDPPDAALDLLLTPWTGTTPGHIADLLRNRLRWKETEQEKQKERLKAAGIAQSTSRVVARIDFLTLVRDVVPLTSWWKHLPLGDRDFQTIFQWLNERIEKDDSLSSVLDHAGTNPEFFRYAALVGFIDRLMNATSVKAVEGLAELARRLGSAADRKKTERSMDGRRTSAPELRAGALKDLIDGYKNATDGILPKAIAGEPEGIFLINLNRPATQSVFDSRKTVKADAAHRVFDIAARGIAFAVVDGGIDASHPAFLKYSDPGFEQRVETDLERWSRVVASYDFTIVRDIIASNGELDAVSEANHDAIVRRMAGLKAEQRDTLLRHLKIRNQNARDLDWEIVAPFIRVPHDKNYEVPGSDHGTHVAGILAADLPQPSDLQRPLVGMCKDLSLYDLRVFDARGQGDEFAILCAIEFVGWLNRDRKNPVVHGVNLSLALAHEVDSFACGQTPICEACNHLVGNGTVVVAAAGNTGFNGVANKLSLGNGYQPISITDPGNADAVITVGSTHRRDPHAYGVSYFSARGPTGDGRRKPDILAPGEKITSTIRGGRSQRMDGTSMAAPHVSGAAALLMARYPELIGRPLRIKEILIGSATDLKRDPDFQGGGLLDVLRALQSI